MARRSRRSLPLLPSRRYEPGRLQYDDYNNQFQSILRECERAADKTSRKAPAAAAAAQQAPHASKGPSGKEPPPAQQQQQQEENGSAEAVAGSRGE